MDNLIERGMLFDFYGDLLTKHQQKIYSAAVFEDLSLGELSEEEGVSRQGIHDLIKRCDRQLQDYEDKLKLIEKYRAISHIIAETKDRLDTEDMDAFLREFIKDKLKKIAEEL